VSGLAAYVGARPRASGQALLADPSPWIALAIFESNLNPEFQRQIGPSTRLRRNASRWGVFALNELWAPFRYKNQARIGSTAALLPPFPFSDNDAWTEADARAAFTTWPAQLHQAHILLDFFLDAEPSLALPGFEDVKLRFVRLWAYWEASSPQGASKYRDAQGARDHAALLAAEDEAVILIREVAQ
jgi:hypothetical protein